jgi:transcriptional regulator with XRE-family HTH domain
MKRAAMDTPAANNRRLAIATAGVRPTCDAIYRKITEEFLRKYALDRDEQFAAAVARRFKEGPARICCRAIGVWIERKLDDFGWTQQGLADRVGVDRSAVARWTMGGGISLGHLVLLLIEFQSDFVELPLPARVELALEGYLAALVHVRQRLDPAWEAEALDRERFWCLYHLFSEPTWELAIRNGDRGRLETEAGRILKRAGESLGERPRRVAGVDGLKRLVEEWTPAWIVCLNFIPRDWSIR